MAVETRCRQCGHWFRVRGLEQPPAADAAEVPHYRCPRCGKRTTPRANDWRVIDPAQATR